MISNSLIIYFCCFFRYIIPLCFIIKNKFYYSFIP
nr:MAG TPA: TMIE protein [Caudoviricetes sp.]